MTSTGTARVEPDPDRPRGLTLHVNGVPSSYLDLDDPGFLAFEYMQQMAAVLDSLPAGPARVVHLGAAGCSLARYVDHTRPGSRQLGVDLDARLLELVRDWFDLPRSPRLRLRADDARHAVSGLPPASADAVVRDVFARDVTPDHLVTAEFAALVRRALRPGGVYLANCADRPPLAGVRREIASIAAAWAGAGVPWDHLGIVAEPALLKGRRYGNVTLVAVAPDSEDPDPPDRSVPDAPGAHRPSVDLASAGLARALRSLAVPAHIVTGPELAAFVGGARPLHDGDHPV